MKEPKLYNVQPQAKRSIAVKQDMKCGTVILYFTKIIKKLPVKKFQQA